MSFEPFCFSTCDPEERPQAFDYVTGRPYAPFPIYNPRGIRRAVTPVVRSEPDGRMFGMGTAFYVDGWGRFLTADHVVDYVRRAYKGKLSIGAQIEIIGPRPALLLSIGVVFGRIQVPATAFAWVDRIQTIFRRCDDPLATLQGRDPIEVAADIAVLKAHIHPAAYAPSPLPLRITGYRPSVGEIVLAIGYPELDFKELDAHARRMLLEEGMFGSYGRVSAIHDQGRDRSCPTPVFEVECNWPAGMSGGPVFNRKGEVIGLVSRSLHADEGETGLGWAADFYGLPDLCDLLRTLDSVNPGWRIGWAVLHPRSCEVIRFFETQLGATAFALQIGGHSLRARNRLGTDQIVLAKE